MITTGEGGMVTIDDEGIHKLAREYHDHGHDNNPNLRRGRDTRRIYGFNYRITEIQTAIGLAQLKKLDSMVQCNRQHNAALEAGLREINGLTFRRVLPACTSLCDALIFELPTAELAHAFAGLMAEQGLDTKNLPDAMSWHFAGIWDHIFSQYGMTKEELWQAVLPSYRRLSRCIALPVMVKYTPEDVERIVATLRKIAVELL